MQIIVLDFETYFDADYTLSKMSTEEYVRGSRFETILVGIHYPEYPDAGDKVYLDKGFREFAKRQDWANTCVIAHHAHFDGLILSHHYGVKPGFWIDTLSMSRLQVGNGRHSLAALCERYGLGSKTIDYTDAGHKGRHAADMSDAELETLANGCLQDCRLTWQLFEKLKVGFPREELEVIDKTVRMFTEPMLVGDQAALERQVASERDAKYRLMNELGVSDKELQSASHFVALLEREGVEVEYKGGKNGPIPAIAKSDDFMRALVDHPDERIATLALARQEAKSTIDETRAARLAAMSGRGRMPVYLNYCGAQTLRFSGGDKVNFQNLRRGSPPT